MDINTDAAFNSFLPGSKPDDNSCVVRFHVRPVLMGAQSVAAQREVYEDREYCEVMVKGQPQQIADEEVTKKHIERFPNAYAAFKAGRAPLIVGTPIEQLPDMSPSQAMNLKTIGIRVMEDMVNLDDMGLQKVGQGARELQKKCKAFLGKSTGENIQLREENAQLKTSVGALTEQMAALQQQMSELLAPKKPGRPKAKVDTAQSVQ